jgi:hypothetical protein
MRLGPALGAFFLSCQPVPQPRPPPVAADAAAPAPVDAGVEVLDRIDEARRPTKDAGACYSPCSCACETLARFNCTEGTPTPHGETCEEVCVDTAKIPGVSLPTFCVMNATTLAQIRKCGVACK